MANPMYGQNKFDEAAAAKIGSVIHVSQAKSLSAEESGSYVMLRESESAVYTVTLPVVSEGLMFTFILEAVSGTGDYDITIAQNTSDSNNIVFGNINGAATFVDVAHDGFIFDTDTATAGDCVQVVSDGTSWYIVFGTSSAAGGIDVYNA